MIDHETILALNRASERETSPMTRDGLKAYLDAAFHLGLRDDGRAAFLIALSEASQHDGVNFAWFRTRYPRFVYIDRIVVADAARGQGHAKSLYAELTAKAIAAGHTMLCCEVNIDPPNEASLKFHAAMGFAEVGRATFEDTGKSVAYLAKTLPP
jgi:uncharacterized protein